MSGGFGDNFEQGDVDPAAEFLAREQNDLAGLEDVVKPAAITSAPITNGTAPVDEAEFEVVDPIDNNELGPSTNDITDNADFLYETDPFAVDNFLTTGNNEIRNVSPSPPPVKEVREEPEKIRKWREEQIKRLEEKDREEELKKQELREKAKKELEEWYKNHEESIAKTKAANRSAEKQYVAEDDEIQAGTEWERIAKLCDFNQKAKQGSKDVSRMRSIVLQMKQSPVPINNKA